jgi:hypothetical protein
MFVRNQNGIRRFEELAAEASEQGIWERLEEIKSRYQKKCPDCGKRFWITDELISTSWFDGKFNGYRCPEDGCSGIVQPEGR